MCLDLSVGPKAVNKRSDVKTVQVLLNLNLARLPGVDPLEVEGVFGDKTSNAIHAFQERILSMSDTPVKIDPGSATLRALVEGMPKGFSAEKLRGIMVNAKPVQVKTFSDLIQERMIARGIDTALRQAHFLAQIGHESGELRYTEELASGEAYEGRADLGNTQPGDGRRFKGRGLIQLTGRANYKAYGDALGVDLLSGENARLVGADPEMAVDVACWFWQSRGLNPSADQDNIERITRVVNGGLNGFADRTRQLTRAKFFLRIPV